MKVFLTYLSDICAQPDLIIRYEALLSESEKIRYQNMSDSNRRLQFLTGRALIQENCHESPSLLENGKPVVSKGYISLAHSGNWVALAVSDTPVGIDIENTGIDRPFNSIAKRMNFPPCADRLSFYKSFTRFEADYKLGHNSKTTHLYYSIDTFIFCISLLNNNENIEFIKSIPFIKNTFFTPQVLQ